MKTSNVEAKKYAVESITIENDRYKIWNTLFTLIIFDFCAEFHSRTLLTPPKQMLLKLERENHEESQLLQQLGLKNLEYAERLTTSEIWEMQLKL